MLWPEMKQGARLLEVVPDEAEGELFIWAVFDEKEYRGIVYEEMFYSQLRENAAGLIVKSVSEIAPIEAKRSKHPQAIRFVQDCRADDEFLRDMYRRDYNLYVHSTEDGGEFIVMAKKCVCGKPRLIKTGYRV